MQSIERRLLAIERKRQHKPIAPCLVIRPGQDEAAALAEFRRVHGCEPWRTFTVRRAPAPPRP